MNCQKCFHSFLPIAIATAPGKPDLQCRRYPPTPVAVGGLTNQGMAVQVLTLWPIVKPIERCGEFTDATINS